MATMITLSRPPFVTILILIVLLPSACRADPDPLQDFCVADLNASISVNGFPCKPLPKVKSDDFFFNGLSKEGNTTNVFGTNVTSADARAFPGLNTLGLSINRVDFAPGGLNPPHIHPRASETSVVIEGKLLAGFVTTGNVLHSKVLKAGEMFVIPRGLVHFQLNVGKGKALFLAAFNSQNPGIVLLPPTLFLSTPSIPNDVLTKAFQIDEKGVTNGFPLRLKVEKEVNFNADFLKNMFPKIKWKALVDAARSMGYTELPNEAESPMLDSEEFLKKFHHTLLQLHLEEGALVCPETGRRFPVSKEIPNMLLHEDEV
ncbi:hypothetical protein HHK36_008094 [Tetracentron sinense]|uniref:Cupin type-1 domain-containing protein n=1 Tax=Tetracentron sinense TaxID=13715 RepID=A0A834ZE39_TETSI|nr:hypothetical protein HHK36_008094 [Tetracentron sinense]